MTHVLLRDFSKVLYAPALLALFACIGIGTAWAKDNVPTVITDIPPVHALVNNVMRGVGTADMLLAQTDDPHHIVLKPSQMRLLSQADIVFWIGRPLTPWLAQILDKTNTPPTRVAFVGGDNDDHDEHKGHDKHNGHDDHDSHNDHDEHKGHDEHNDHDEHATIDPHIWLNPDTAKHMVDTIAKTLSTHNHAHRRLYERNAQKTKAALTELEKHIGDELKGIEFPPMVVMHDAYQHFFTAFDVPSAYVLADSHADPIGVRGLNDLLDDLSAENNPRVCLFVEPNHTGGVVSTLETALKDRGKKVFLGVFDPLGNNITKDEEFYPALLQGLTRALQACAAARQAT